MSAKFAAATDVPVERSKAEIEATVTRYGATSFASGWQAGSAVISFEMRDRRVRFDLPLPSRDDQRFTHHKVNQRPTAGLVPRSPDAALKAWEQACRQLWRAMLLVIKAKLEAVASGIRSFEQEFLNDLVTSSGLTVGQLMQPRLADSISSGKLPPLLESPRA